MSRILTDDQISKLLDEPKPITSSQIKALKAKLRRTPRDELQSKLTVVSESGRRFSITASRCLDPAKPKKFSIILTYTWHKRDINLIRCNGHHGLHENKIEARMKLGTAEIPPNTFRIHRATERYQVAERAPESYAEPTQEYCSFESAIDFLCDNFGFFLAGSDYKKRFPLWETRT